MSKVQRDENGEPESAPEVEIPGREQEPGEYGTVPIENAPAACEWIREELGAGGLSGVYHRSGELVWTPRVGEEGYVAPSDEKHSDGPAQVQVLHPGLLQAWATVAYAFTRFDARSKKDVPVTCPSWLSAHGCQIGRAAPEKCPNLKTLKGVTHVPLIRPDGSLLYEPGYDDATGVLFLPDPDVVFPAVPEKPTDAEILQALHDLMLPFAEFPFQTPGDRANFLGVLMLPALRLLVPPPYPLVVYSATNPGSGKSWLSKANRSLYGGVLIADFPGDNEEFKKTVTARLLTTTAPIVTFDNVKGVVRSSGLEALLTTDAWTQRYLGESRDVTVPNDRIWSLTANNATLGGDLKRRHIRVGIDPGVPNPHLRTGFLLPVPPHKYVEAHRGAMVSAVLTLARGWVAAGMPTVVARSDDYKTLSETVGGIVDWLQPYAAKISADWFDVSLGEFMSKEVGATIDNADEDDLAAWIHALHASWGGGWHRAADVVAVMGGTDLTRVGLAQHLPSELAEAWSKVATTPEGMVKQTSAVGFAKRYGEWAKRNLVGRFTDDGYRVEYESSRNRGGRYRVVAPGDV